jgi:hypothetical protein
MKIFVGITFYIPTKWSKYVHLFSTCAWSPRLYYITSWKATCSQVSMDMPRRTPRMCNWRITAIYLVKMPMKYNDCSTLLLISEMWFSDFEFRRLYSFCCVGPWVWKKTNLRLSSILHFTPTWYMHMSPKYEGLPKNRCNTHIPDLASLQH